MLKIKLRFPDKVSLFCMAFEMGQELKESVWNIYKGYIAYLLGQAQIFKQSNPKSKSFYSIMTSKSLHSQFKDLKIFIKIKEKKK